MIACADYDVEDYECDQENEENSLSREDLVAIVKKYISSYFEDKNISPDVDLYSSRYIDFCLDCDICKAVDKVYCSIEKSGKFEIVSSEHSISEDIRFVIKTLGQIKKQHVPQEFSAGILLMHCEILEGIPLQTEI